jgi:EAL domain-containing protein (putative c-di-GMP-specific phosphodiesterase class I)
MVMTSDHGLRPPSAAYPPERPERYAPSIDEPLRRLIALAALAVDMPAGVSLYVGSMTVGPITSAGYDRALGDLVAGLDAAVVDSGRPLAVPDLADRSAQMAATPNPTSGAYLGVPLMSSDNSVTGVLHVLDREPRPMVDGNVSLLSAFGRAICDHLELRAQVDAAEPDDERVADVAQAIRAGEIVPWYQPIVDLSTGRVVGLEALARWSHPDGRIESPAVFVPIAERSDLIVDVDLAVAGRAMNDLQRWQRTHPALQLSVNLSGRHVDSDDWVTVIAGLATQSGVAATTVHLEITETVRPVPSVAGVARMHRARSLGFSLWLDDFGSGWSSLCDLLHLPVDGIKIDRSFAAALGTKVDNAVIRALTTAAAELGLMVTIEGIERREQAALARDLGCHRGQGFLWSVPVPGPRVDHLLASADGTFQPI